MVGPFERGVRAYESQWTEPKKNQTSIDYPTPFEPFEMDRDMVRYSRLKRNIGVAAKCHEVNTPIGKKNHNVIMVTLTYAADTWHAKHISNYVDHVRKWLDRRCGEKLRYIWVGEIQTERLKKTGEAVLHYHVIYWLPKGVTMPKADKQGWWPHGSTRTEKAVSPVKYIMKYASKLDSKEGYPDGARTYGVGGLVETARNSRRWLNLPSFIKARASISDRWTRFVGGGWLEHATQKVWPSEWGLCLVTRAKLHIVRVHDHGRPVEDVAGPFEWIRPLNNPALAAT